MWKKSFLLSVIVCMTLHIASCDNLTLLRSKNGNILAANQNGHRITKGNFMAFSNCSASNDTSNNSQADCILCSCATSTPSISNHLTAECEVSEDVLQRLMNLLRRAWEIITIPGEAENSWKVLASSDICASMIPSKLTVKKTRKSFPPESTRPSSVHVIRQCEDYLEDMEELIVALTEQIRLLILSLDDPAFLWPKIAQLESCIACLNRKMSDLEQEYGQKLGNLTQQLINMKDCFTLEIRRQADQISQLELRLDAKSFQVISANVNASNHTGAVIEFNRLKNPYIMPDLVKDLYSSQRIENILTFGMLVNFNNIEKRAEMFEQLQELMKNDPARKDIHQVLFYKALADDTKYVCKTQEISYCRDLPLKYFNLIVSAVEDIDRIIANWAAGIQQGNHKSLWVLISPDDKVSLAGEAFQDLLPKIILKAIDQNVDRNLKNTLDFISGLRWNKQRLLGFKTLLEAVSSNAHAQITVAAKMKVAMESLAGPDGKAENVLDEFLILKRSLMQHVMHIIWGSACNIKYRGNCLTCSSGMEASNGGTYFTTSCSSEYSKWQLLPIKINHQADGLLFKFRNIGHSRYLGSHIPWKNTDPNMAYGIVSCSTQDFGEYADKHYLWRLSLKSDSNMSSLFHVGRKGTLGNDVGIYLSSNSDAFIYEIVCTGGV